MPSQSSALPQLIYVMGRANDAQEEGPTVESNLTYLNGRDGVDFDLHIVGNIEEIFSLNNLVGKIREITVKDPASKAPITIILDGHGRTQESEINGRWRNDAIFDKTPLSAIYQEIAAACAGRPLHMLILSCDADQSRSLAKIFLPNGSLVYTETTRDPLHYSVCRTARPSAFGRYFTDAIKHDLITELIIARLMRGHTLDETSNAILTTSKGVTSLLAAAKRIITNDAEGLKERMPDLEVDARVQARILNGIIYLEKKVPLKEDDRPLRTKLMQMGQLAPILALTILYMMTEPREKWAYQANKPNDAAPT